VRKGERGKGRKGEREIFGDEKRYRDGPPGLTAEMDM
jgi:hypothetical protein